MKLEFRLNLIAKYHETLQQILLKSRRYDKKYLFKAFSQHFIYSLEKFKGNPVIDFETADKLTGAFMGSKEKWTRL